MKTAISIPDTVFEMAEQLAKRLGMSRSELYTKAVASFVEGHQDKTITALLNEIYAEEESSLDPGLHQMIALSIPVEEW